MKILKIVRLLSLLAASVLTLSVCSAGQTERGIETKWPDLSGDWAMVQVLVATADLPILGTMWIDTVVGVFTHLTQSGSLLIMEDRYCFTDATPSTILFETDIPEIVMQSIHPDPREAWLTLDDCDFLLTQDWYTEVRGAILADPENDPLPTDPEDPRLVDLEGDGNPGITLQVSILGLLNGEGYAVQRYRYRLDGTMFDADTIIGYIDWTSEQRMVAATHELFMARFEDSTDPDPTKHKFAMIRVDETWTCETLREQLPNLLDLLDL